eukprot:CAMPEP_0115857994 /NCGR_PEP_ID=MMETSP0287-20121206/15864_1 /TAXON_ID=412157 /ORGANISM="Chrysochromulina rotalis, Strain UIO044" /LENGTH=52 /DNA_ID=CAMNT_0003312235 /DNA_START=91 /DNA_END=246 /DNA_ORIENTATION=+
MTLIHCALTAARQTCPGSTEQLVPPRVRATSGIRGVRLEKVEREDRRLNDGF